MNKTKLETYKNLSSDVGKKKVKTDDLGFVLLKGGHLSVGLNSKIRQATEECFEVTNKNVSPRTAADL